jgi:SAM-dependent methyltransferase
MFLTHPYQPVHGENRMRYEGDVARARHYYFSAAPRNLRFLLAHRYEWMNAHIPADGAGIEVGCGSGLSKEFIRAKDYKLTDYADHPWIDVPNVDALNTPFADRSLDFVVSSNMIHHVPYPVRFFAEMNRILKPGGVLLVQELNASLAMRGLLRLMRHEGYSYDPDVFDPDLVCTDPDDLWSANCAIPNLLFDDPDTFHEKVPYFRMVTHRYREFTCFINSGGVIAKTFCVPLPRLALWGLKLIDDVLTWALPGVFALQRQLVLRKVGEAASAARYRRAA